MYIYQTARPKLESSAVQDIITPWYNSGTPGVDLKSFGYVQNFLHS